MSRESAMNDLYHCFSCDAINRASNNAWCCCGGLDPTLVCEKCGRCFCTAPDAWKKEFWSKYAAVVKPNSEELARPVILIIDDDRVIHSVAARVLAEFPGTVLHAFDGAEGLRIAQQVVPDLVITDCLMPRVDGREIARVLKTSAATRAVRVVAMTSLYRGAKYREEALRDFLVDEYVVKPVSAARLREIASGVLQ